MIKAKFKNKIHSYVFVNERILQLRYKLQRGYLILLAVYSPEEGKTEKNRRIPWNPPKSDRENKKNDYIFFAEDYNARVGNIPTDWILSTNGEITVMDTN